MSLRNILIDLHGSQRSLFSLGQDLARQKVKIREPEVGISHSAVSKRVVVVHRDCLLESLDRFQHPFFVVLVPEIAAPEIEIVSLYIVCRLFSETYLILARQLKFQTLPNGFRYLVLNCQKVRRAAIVLLAPELRSVGNFNQLAPDDQFLFQPKHTNHHHSPDFELETN